MVRQFKGTAKTYRALTQKQREEARTYRQWQARRDQAAKAAEERAAAWGRAHLADSARVHTMVDASGRRVVVEGPMGMKVTRPKRKTTRFQEKIVELRKGQVKEWEAEVENIVSGPAKKRKRK